jgi:hypothetical protein
VGRRTVTPSKTGERDGGREGGREGGRGGDVSAEFGGVINRGEEDGHAVEDWREGGTDGRRAR